MTGVGEGDERVLLEKFHHVVALFLSLTKSSQTVIANITMRMGQGLSAICTHQITAWNALLGDVCMLSCHC